MNDLFATVCYLLIRHIFLVVSFEGYHEGNDIFPFHFLHQSLSYCLSFQGEGIQSFFNVNGYSRHPDGFHNRVNTRPKLMQYDLYLYRLLERLFPCHNNYITRCWAKGNVFSASFDCRMHENTKLFNLIKPAHLWLFMPVACNQF